MAHPTIAEQITFLYTTDLKRSAAFYEEVLGLDLALDQGGCRIYRLTSSAYVGICERPAGEIQDQDPGRRSVIVTLVTQDVDLWYETLKQRGVVFDHPPRRNEHYRIYHTFLRDPNGYLIEIQRFDDEPWVAG